MKSKWSVVSLAALGLMVAALAFAADAAKQQGAVAQQPNARAGIAEDAGSWDADADDFGPLAWGDGDEYGFGPGAGPGGGPGFGPGDGRGQGPGFRGAHGRRGGMGRHAGIGRGMGRGMGLGAAFARLDLSDEQREKLAAIHEERMRANVRARADLQIAGMDLRKLMRADSPNATAINAQIDKLTRMRGDMQKSRVAAFLEARTVLTPEQQKQLHKAGPAGRARGFQRPQRGGQPD